MTDKFLIGVDLGKTTASFAVGVRGPDGLTRLVESRSVRHLGRVAESFKDFYLELGAGSIEGVAVTGLYSRRVGSPAVSGLPEEIAQERATAAFYPEGPVNIVRLGGRGYSILTRDEKGSFNYVENDRCSAGTGETIEKICGRLGLSLQEAMDMAGRATRSIPITARCSVFAKSEMTHFANQGEPHEELLKGYFESVARNVYGLYDKYRVDGPTALIGNGALIGPVAKSFMEKDGGRVEVCSQAGEYEALGALYYAADRGWDEGLEWPADPSIMIAARERRVKGLEPASKMGGKVVKLEERAVSAGPSVPAILGIDLGSTGSKAALLDAESGEVMADFYRRTDGNPVEAAKALAGEVLEAAAGQVIAIGLTGSGRDAAATAVRAAFPGAGDRIFVQNEIVAHAAAAIALDPDKGRSLSIVEIGGQDAKFINVKNGRVLESDMNRACSAGTGSFLEEQGIFYDVADVARFGEMAATSERPPDLGQMCTVFVADLAAVALAEGYTVADLFAGFQYSVITNYKNRVMGNRQFMDRIFFQGKPATSPSLARTLAAVTGREVYVPPNPGAMGAIGVAMLARESIADARDLEPLDLRVLTSVNIKSRKTFRCNDPKCKNMCRIERAEVEVMGKTARIVSGGSCPKYESVSAGPRKLPSVAPSPYRERQDLLASCLPEVEKRAGRPTVGLPRGHYLIDYLPFFYAFFAGLGVNVEILDSDHETFERGNRRCSAGNTCTPVKIMHGLARADLDFLFMPKFVELPRPVRKSGACTCPMVQATPELVEKALEAEGARTKILRPHFYLGDYGLSSPGFLNELRKCRSAVLGAFKDSENSLLAFASAYREALSMQEEYEGGLMEIGRRALAFAREEGYPAVLIAGSSHVIHEPIMNAGIHELVTANGALAIPLDCFPVDDDVPPLERVYWGTSNRILRASIQAAREALVFPLMIVSYGCGPSSFVEHLFNHLLEDYPHTVLESDGHGGKAGYVTRVQAFLYSARSYEPGKGGEGKEAGKDDDGYLARIQFLLGAARSYKKGLADSIPERKIALYDKKPIDVAEIKEKFRVVISACDRVGGEQSRQVLLGGGYDADYGLTGAPGAFELARQDCSGKECLPYQRIWSAYRGYLEKNPPRPGEKMVLLNVSGEGPCRNGMFTLANQIALEKLGWGDRIVSTTSSSFKNDPYMAYAKWFAIVGTDLLNQLRLFYRPEEKIKGDADEIYYDYCLKISRSLVKFGRSGGLREVLANIRSIEEVLEDGARAFSDMGKEKGKFEELRTIYLCGDVFLLVDEDGNDQVARRFNDLGLRVLAQPFGDIMELVMFYRTREFLEMETRPVLNYMVRGLMEYARERLVGRVRRYHDWIKWDGIETIDEACKELLDGSPFCESITAIGSSLLAWRDRPIDGLAAIGPWGCGPALITEAQLRRKLRAPMLFLTYDGDPIDQNKLEGFAWRLKNSPKRLLRREDGEIREAWR